MDVEYDFHADLLRAGEEHHIDDPVQVWISHPDVFISRTKGCFGSFGEPRDEKAYETLRDSLLTFLVQLPIKGDRTDLVFALRNESARYLAKVIVQGRDNNKQANSEKRLVTAKED